MKKDSPYNPKVVRAYFAEMDLPSPCFEYRFSTDRKWSFDLAFLAEKVAVEVQGGLFIWGRHNRGAALLKEYEKLNAAACAGWRLLYCQPKDLCTSDLVRTLHLALNYDNCCSLCGAQWKASICPNCQRHESLLAIDRETG